MKTDNIIFARQLLDKMDTLADGLWDAKEANTPREFNKIKEELFGVHKEMEKLLE